MPSARTWRSSGWPARSRCRRAESRTPTHTRGRWSSTESHSASRSSRRSRVTCGSRRWRGPAPNARPMRLPSSRTGGRSARCSSCSGRSRRPSHPSRARVAHVRRVGLAGVPPTPASRGSERRRNELERVTESRARLIRGLSHDVKNPLGAAAGYAALLLEPGALGDLSVKQREGVERISRSIQISLRLIEDCRGRSRGDGENQCRARSH